jgi:hypothetical protein
MYEDFAGNALGTAKALELTSSLQTFTGSVSPLDTIDYYGFNLSNRSSFNLTLSGLDANADIELLNSRGEVLQTSAQLGTSSESLLTTLDAGSYYINGYSGAETTTDYNLSLSATPSQYATSLQSRDVLTGFDNPSFDTGVFTVGSSGQVSIDYFFDGRTQSDLSIFSREGMDTSLPDADGNGSMSTAWQLNSPGDLGSGTFHPVNVSLSGLSVGSTDHNDSYSLNLRQAQYVNIKLDGLSANANIQLIKDLNNNGQIDFGEVLESSTKIGNAAELISTRLEAGTYFVQVYSEDNTNAQYNLSVVSRLWNVQPDNGSQPINGFQQVTPKPDSVYFSDVTGDGKEDALVINNWGTTNRRSDGTKFLPNEDWTTDPYFGANRTYYADVDGDGKADAIVSNQEGVFIRRSDGSQFGADERWTEIGYGGDKGTFFADVTGDGKADAIVVNTINNVGVTVRRSDGTKFLPNELWTDIGYAGKFGIYFADVDGDGKADAIVSNDDGITVRRSDGTKFLPNEKWTDIGYGGDKGLFFADVTGDGKADAIVVNTINNVGVTVRRSDGTKFLPNELWTDIGYAGEKGTFFADVDGDGKADAVVSNEWGVTVRRSDGTKFLPNETWTEIGYGGEGGHGSVVKGSGDAVYLVQENQRRHIPNPETWNYMGLGGITSQNYISDADLNDIPLGVPLPSRKNGDMVQGSGAAVYVMENGNRRLIPDPPTLDSMGLNWNNIQHIADTDLNNIPDGASLPSRTNGAMVQGSGAAVYLMESGKRRLIPNPETFNAMRLDWNAIQHIADADLNNIPEGEPLPAVSSVPPLPSNPTESNPLRGFRHPLGWGEETPIRWTHWDGFGQKYAVDFGAGFGTPVYAMRSGTVVSWQDNTADRDPKLSFIDDGKQGTTANFLLVKLDDNDGHDDGYRTMYLHLKQGSIPAKFKQVGVRVETGEYIGDIGYNGLSQGVHLHAEVNTGSSVWNRQTVPFQWK